MTVTIYGIRNCDTMKKARAWLDARGVAYTFHDYAASGISGRSWRAGPGGRLGAALQPRRHDLPKAARGRDRDSRKRRRSI